MSEEDPSTPLPSVSTWDIKQTYSFYNHIPLALLGGADQIAQECGSALLTLAYLGETLWTTSHILFRHLIKV